MRDNPAELDEDKVSGWSLYVNQDTSLKKY